MTTAGALAVACATAAVVIELAPSGRVPRAPRPHAVGTRRAAVRRPVAALLSVSGPVLLVGGVRGLVLGAVLGAVAWRWLDGERRETAGETGVHPDLPHLVAVLGAVLRSGADPMSALRSLGHAWHGDLAAELVSAARRLEVGVDPATVYGDLGRHRHLGPLGRALARAHDSGASVAGAVARCADDLRAEVRSAGQVRARSLGARVSAPLGLCLLPALVLLGVVPLVAGLVTQMTWWR